MCIRDREGDALDTLKTDGKNNLVGEAENKVTFTTVSYTHLDVYKRQASPTGENLQVTVKNVTCETNGNYQYDGSGVLNAGSGGSVYRIEYEAVSPTNAEER